MNKMDAKFARVMIWEQLRKVAKPDSRFSFNFAEFITDYEGSEKGADLLVAQDFYRNAKVCFVTPDNNMDQLREYIIRDKKTLIMTNYSISRGFFLLEPGMVPEGKEELASTLDGIQRFWKHCTLAQLKEKVTHIDMLVTGA
ncbi:MAG: methenyltetrahydrofolate synthetase, partial [Anaerovoracaceae bacterium]